MTINDEMLSAYLDNELSEQDHARVQACLQDDASVADRLAHLASINALVAKQAALIDQVPMPESVMAMLRPDDTAASSSAPRSDNVVDISGFRKARQRIMHVVRDHAALAASLALLVGFACGQLLPGAGSNQSSGDANAALFTALDSVPSGQQLSLDADTSLTARFSFRDTQARFCRQFLIQDSQGSTENLACRDQDQWSLVASARSSAVASSAQYQPASGPRLLDNMLDAMMQGSALSQAEEQTAINNQWQTE